nr:MAG TPA: hypothetical protein [Caudoviricetes sp.]
MSNSINILRSFLFEYAIVCCPSYMTAYLPLMSYALLIAYDIWLLVFPVNSDISASVSSPIYFEPSYTSYSFMFLSPFN